MKLKIRIWLNENIVCMQVLEQELDGHEFRVNRFNIKGVPAESKDIIYLRDKRSKYNNWIEQFVFDTEQEAQEYLEKVVYRLDDEFVGDTEPKEGDVVEVKCNGSIVWDKRPFLFKDKNGKIYCVNDCDKYNYYYNEGDYGVSSWDKMQPIKQSLYNPETEIWEWEG